MRCLDIRPSEISDVKLGDLGSEIITLNEA